MLGVLSKMLRKKLSFISLLLVIVFFLTTVINVPVVEAATFKDINKSSVFIKQKTNYTCTLASTTMLIRRVKLAEGKKTWSSITESKMRRKIWIEGCGIYNNFTYEGVKVKLKKITSNRKKEYISLLKKHPEGVVAYNKGKGGQYHAILLTDYNAATDTFYCADPAKGTSKGRIPLSKSSIVGSNQNKKINNLTMCWYVSSKTPTLKDTAKTKVVKTKVITKTTKKK